MVQQFLKGVHPVYAATVSLAFMTLPAAGILWQQGFLENDWQSAAVQGAILSSVILGVAGSAIATALFYVLVQKAGGLFASLVTYGIPFIALFWGFLDGESITVAEIVCLCVILAGVYIANRQDRRITEDVKVKS